MRHQPGFVDFVVNLLPQAKYHKLLILLTKRKAALVFTINSEFDVLIAQL
jgi:hypothetical protein